MNGPRIERLRDEPPKRSDKQHSRSKNSPKSGQCKRRRPFVPRGIPEDARRFIQRQAEVGGLSRVDAIVVVAGGGPISRVIIVPQGTSGELLSDWTPLSTAFSRGR
jgi:hypothetical protein